jgi:hypothetical protein
MRLPVPPREQQGNEDASPPQPCKSEFQKNTGAPMMVYFPIKAKARPSDFKAGNSSSRMEMEPHFNDAQGLVFMDLEYNNLSRLLIFIFYSSRNKRWTSPQVRVK